MARTQPNMRTRFTRNVKRSASEANRWFLAGGTFWVWLALATTIILLFYLMPGQLHDRVRWAGTIFEFVGICVIVYGIDKTRRSFGKPFLLHEVWIWLKELRFVFVRRPTISASANLQAGAAVLASFVTVVTRKAHTIEQRIAQLETEAGQLRTDLGTLDKRVAEQFQELRTALDKEAAARQVEVLSINKRLEAEMIGHSHVELAGVAYLLLGLPMANASDVVANCLSLFGLR